MSKYNIFMKSQRVINVDEKGESKEVFETVL